MVETTVPGKILQHLGEQVYFFEGTEYDPSAFALFLKQVLQNAIISKNFDLLNQLLDQFTKLEDPLNGGDVTVMALRGHGPNNYSHSFMWSKYFHHYITEALERYYQLGKFRDKKTTLEKLREIIKGEKGQKVSRECIRRYLSIGLEFLGIE